MREGGGFPGWAAPIVGMLLGGLVAIKAARREGGDFAPQYLLVGAAIGILGGCIVWVVDVLRGGKQN